MPRRKFDFDSEGTVTNGIGDDVELAGVAADFNEWRRSQGLEGRVYVKGGKKRVHSVFISDPAYDGLKYLAQAYRTYHGGEPSVSALLEAIGTMQLKLGER